MAVALGTVIAKLVGPKVIKKLGMDAIESLLKSSLDGKGNITNVTMDMIKGLNNGSINNKDKAKRVSKTVKEARERLADPKAYNVSTGQRIVQDAILPLVGAAARTAGAGYNLYRQILPAIMKAAADNANKINPLQAQELGAVANPVALMAAFTQGKANFEGGVANMAGQELGNIVDQANENYRADTNAALNRQYITDSAIGYGLDFQNVSPSQADVYTSMIDHGIPKMGTRKAK